MKPPVPPHVLQGLEVFSGLDPFERARIAAGFETLELKRGDVLVREGEPADALYIVVSGRFAVTFAGRRDRRCEIGSDQPIGEIAFLAGGTRTATVTAMRDSLVMKLDHAAFDRLAAESPALWRSLTVALAQRLAAVNTARPAPPDPRPRTITVIRAGEQPVPPRFIRALGDVFASAARSLVIEPHAVEALLPAGAHLDSHDATQALNALESSHDYVIYVADAEPTAWSEKALRQADLVLAVGVHSADAAPNALERLAYRFLPQEARRLVLLHDKRSRVRGTQRWLQGRDVAMHHHVALDARGDVERLFRFINGTARGLVTSGGGALCAAHVGLYKALLGSDVSFDIMGGTSGGGAMAAAFAIGTDPDAIDDALHEIFVLNSAMRRYTWPRYSLIDHTGFDRQLFRYFGGFDIEDLWIPYFAVSTDLSRYDLHRHRRGDLWAAVRASGSIPVLLPPLYTEDGHMLVDGGLLDNVPIRIMHELKSGPNVVISFFTPELERFDVDYRALPSRPDLLWRIANPWRRRDLPQAPGLVTVLMRSLMANRQDFKRHLKDGDLMLIPPVPQDVGLLDWHRHRELVAATYAWGIEEIARLKAAGCSALGE